MSQLTETDSELDTLYCMFESVDRNVIQAIFIEGCERNMANAVKTLNAILMTGQTGDTSHQNDKSSKNKPNVHGNDNQIESKYNHQDLDGYVLLQEQKEPTLALEVFGVECEEISCDKKCAPSDIFFCTHYDCEADNSLYCATCMMFKHRNKNHKFVAQEKYIKCVEKHLRPDQSAFDKNKAKAAMIVKVADVEKFLFHHRWTMGAGVKAVTILSTTTAAHAVNHACTLFSAMGTGSVGLVAGSIGGAAGAIIGSAVECVFIWRQRSLGKISTREACVLSGISLASNIVAGGTFIGALAIGAAVGAPGGLVGCSLGALVASILFGLGLRYGLNKWFEKTFKQENDDRMNKELQKRAFKYFFGNEKYDINDEEKFNDKILRKKYHRFALSVFPDREGGDNDEWLKLSGFYGVLIGLWEEKHGKDRTISSAQDLSENEKQLTINAVIKRSISEEKKDSV